MAFLYRLVQSKFSFELNLYDLMNAERKYSAFGVQNAVSNSERSLEHEKKLLVGRGELVEVRGFLQELRVRLV